MEVYKIVIIGIVYFIGIGATVRVLNFDRLTGHEVVGVFSILVWPVSLLIIIGNKIGDKIR